METTQDPAHHYILTGGLSACVRTLRYAHIIDWNKCPEQPGILDDLEKELVKSIDEAVGADNATILVSETDLEREIHSIVQEIDGQVVNASRDIALPSQFHLDVTRLANRQGQFIGHGPRPGTDYLNRQFDLIKKGVGDCRVVLIEDGAYTGKTVRFILNKLKEHQISQAVIVVGMIFREAKFTLLDEIARGDVVIVRDESDAIDWLPLHDLIPFTPRSGKVLGHCEIDGKPYPVYDYHGVSLSFPYIEPFSTVHMRGWTSIGEPDVRRKLSQKCLEITSRLYHFLDSFRVEPITIEDLVGVRSGNFSVPVVSKTTCLNPGRSVVSFLEEAQQNLA